MESFPDIQIQRWDTKKSIATIHIIDDSDDEDMEPSTSLILNDPDCKTTKFDPLANLRASLNSLRDATPSTNFQMLPPPKLINRSDSNCNDAIQSIPYIQSIEAKQREIIEVINLNDDDENHEIKIPNTCHFCGMENFNETQLLKHIKKCETLKILCPFTGCRRRFLWKCHLREHYRRKHSKERPFTCKSCSKKFFSRGNLRQHCLNVHGAFDYNDPDYKDPSIGITIEADTEVIEVIEPVMDAVTEGDDGVVAISLVDDDGDEEMLQQLDEMEMKIVRLLVAIKNGDYTQCIGKGKSGGNGRKKGRSAGKKWKCPFCPRSYTRRGNMNRHIEHVHGTAGHTFNCDFCAMEFGDHATWKRHQLAHLDQKEYSCDHCDFQTHWMHNLKRHVVSGHPEVACK